MLYALSQPMFDLPMAKLSLGTKIHSKTQISKSDTYRCLPQRVYNIPRKHYSPHSYRLVLEAGVRCSVKEEVEDRGKGWKGCTEKQSISLPHGLQCFLRSGDVNRGT